MLNRLLSRTGRRIGVLVSAGQEDYLRIERGIQTYLGFSYSDRLHLATHFHNDPIVPRELVKGVRGRIDVIGAEVLPLREQDVREGAAALFDAGVEGICVCFLFSYRNAEHEIRSAEIVSELRAERGLDAEVPLYLSSELYPLRRDLPRLNSTLIEAYAAEPSRGSMQKVRGQTKAAGAGFELRVMASHGGTISIEAKELATTLVSGPIGGVVGGQALAERLGAAKPALHRHRRDQLRHRADHRRALRDHADARHRPLHAQHAARPHRLDRRRHGLVRARQPELGPSRARARLGRLADRRQLAAGRPRHRLGHRPERGPRPRQPRVLPRRRRDARSRARPRRGDAPGRRAPRPRGRPTPPRA